MVYNFSDRFKDLKGNAIREIFKLLADPAMISFAGGLPAADILPAGKTAQYIVELMASDAAKDILQYGGTAGYIPFLKASAKVLERAGIKDFSLDKVIAVSGGQQGIDLMFKAFCNKGDNILVENPTYLAALHIAKTYEANCYGVDADDDGLIIADLEKKIIEHKPKILYVVPTFSNPTGKTYSGERRRQIAELTAKYNVMVLEDDPYSELRFSGGKVSALKTYDKAGNVVYVTSFSKTVAPGFRTGIAFGAPEVIAKLIIGKQAADVHTGSLNQAMIERFISTGELFNSIERAKPLYKEKKDAMTDAIKKYMPDEFVHTDPDGGLFIFGTLPESIDAEKLLPEVCRLKVAYVAGTAFFADGRGSNTLRLNYSNATLEQIDKGIKTLGEFFKSRMGS